MYIPENTWECSGELLGVSMKVYCVYDNGNINVPKKDEMKKENLDVSKSKNMER